jgi:hypothetical protein
MARKFEELVLDGHNYPTWALNVKISLTFKGILRALSPPTDREAAFLDIQVPSTIHHPESPPP